MKKIENMKNVPEILPYTEDITINSDGDIETGYIAIAEISNTTLTAVPLMTIVNIDLTDPLTGENNIYKCSRHRRFILILTFIGIFLTVVLSVVFFIENQE